jgi:hypothetical protein
MTIRTLTFILLLSVPNIRAQSVPDYNLLLLNYGFGNFGLNHQLSGETASFREIQLKYYPRLKDRGNLSVSLGIVFNYEKGYWSDFGPNKYPYDLTSRLYYIDLQSGETYKYFGFKFGFMLFHSESGFHNEGSLKSYARPSVGFKLGIINQIYAFMEINNDLILTPVYTWPPVFLGFTYVLLDAINSISLGYFNNGSIRGYDLKVTYTVFKNLLFHTQIVYRPVNKNIYEPEQEIFCFRFGIGIKI